MRRSHHVRRYWDPKSLRGCVLYLPFYKYGANQSKIWDMSVQNLGPNVVSNGGMEDGDPPTGWGTFMTPEVFERSAVQKHSGNYSLHINDSTPSYGGVDNEIVEILNGKTIKKSFWYYIVSGAIVNRMYDGSGQRDWTPLLTTGSWQYFEIIIPNIVNNFEHGIINGSNTVAAEFYIDDVSIQEVGYNGGVNHGTITGATPTQTPLLSNVEMITDGGMENWTTDTDLTSWDEYISGSSTINKDAADKHSGSFSCRIFRDAVGSAVHVSQNVPFVPGKRYRLSFWYKSDIASGFKVYSCAGAEVNSAFYWPALPAAADWTYVEAIAVATSSDDVIRIRRNAAAQEATGRFDDVSIQEVVGYQSLGWQFDGVDDLITLTSSPSLNFGTGDFSILAWAKSQPNLGANSSQRIIAKRDASNVGWELYFDEEDKTCLLIGDAGGINTAQGTTSVQKANRWYCLVGVFDRDGDCYIYVNGTFEGWNTISTRSGTINNTQDALVGRYASAAVSFFRGSIGEVLLFDRVLSAAEVKNYYEATRGRYGA